MVIDKLMLKEGVLFPQLYFDGTKKELKEAINSGQIITFTCVDEGRSQEINIAGSSVLTYGTDIDSEEIIGVDLSTIKGNNIILFPTAGHAPTADETKAIETIAALLTGTNSIYKKPPFSN